jgi:1-acyl-sn-glycerol-3-phosphate acyltransferase
MPLRYPVPWDLLFHLSVAIAAGRRRSFGEDARACAAILHPEMLVLGKESIPAAGPCLVTTNHYSRPGFRAWWLALAISAVMPYEVLWTVTAAWTYPDGFRKRVITPLTRSLFRRTAAVYGFVNMPPMPPDPYEAMARAQAVRAVISYAQKVDRPVIAMAPEGMDFPGGVLGSPPAGTGRFMLHLASLGMGVLPVGAYEDPERFCIHFGTPYRLDVSQDLPVRERDRIASKIVMSHIAGLLPENLRGQYEQKNNDWTTLA